MGNEGTDRERTEDSAVPSTRGYAGSSVSTDRAGRFFLLLRKRIGRGDVFIAAFEPSSRPLRLRFAPANQSVCGFDSCKRDAKKSNSGATIRERRGC